MWTKHFLQLHLHVKYSTSKVKTDFCFEVDYLQELYVSVVGLADRYQSLMCLQSKHRSSQHLPAVDLFKICLGVVLLFMKVTTEQEGDAGWRTEASWWVYKLLSLSRFSFGPVSCKVGACAFHLDNWRQSVMVHKGNIRSNVGRHLHLVLCVSVLILHNVNSIWWQCVSHCKLFVLQMAKTQRYFPSWCGSTVELSQYKYIIQH